MSLIRPTRLTSESFDQLVINGDRPVLVDFHADWCPPCRALAPTIDELAQEYDGRAVVAKVNVDDEAELASRFGIRSIPTILLFQEGEIAQTFVGLTPQDTLAEALDAAATPAQHSEGEVS